MWALIDLLDDSAVPHHDRMNRVAECCGAIVPILIRIPVGNVAMGGRILGVSGAKGGGACIIDSEEV